MLVFSAPVIPVNSHMQLFGLQIFLVLCLPALESSSCAVPKYPEIPTCLYTRQATQTEEHLMKNINHFSSQVAFLHQWTVLR